MRGLVQSKLVEWIIYLVMFAAAVYLLLLMLPSLVGGDIAANPGVIR